MRTGTFVLLLVMLVVVSAVSAQTTSPRTSTSVWDLQTSLGVIALDSSTQYASGTGVRLTASASIGVASFAGTNAPFLVNEIVPSWNLDLPADTGARMEVRAVNGSTSTIWYEVGRMGVIPGGIKRNTSDPYGYIDIDTLKLSSTWPRVEYRVTLYTRRTGVTPTLRLMSLNYADTGTLISYSPLPGPGVTTTLPVPWRSQYWVPNIGGVICGPTSLTMAEDYYGCDLPTETVAAECYDDYNKLYGNWPNIAQAAAKHGFKAYTFRANGQQPLRDQFAAGNAVIMTMNYTAGELTNSPISSTGGHLVLMVGVTAMGDYICNDPAGADSRWDHVIYNAGQIAHVWLYHAGGVCIAVMPNLVYGRYPTYTYQSTAPVATDTKGKMSIAVRSISGAIHMMQQVTPNGGWEAWTGMGGPATSDPVIVTNRNKGNTMFARFTDGNLYYRMQSSPGALWSGWGSLGGQIVGTPAVGKSPDGRLDVFCRIADGSIQHIWEATGSGWQTWELLGNPSAADDPVVALTWEGREEVYVRGTDNQLYWKYQLNNGSWSAWTAIGASIAGQPAIGRTADGRVQVFCRFADGLLRSNTQTSTDVGTSWAGWAVLGSTAVSDPVLARLPSGIQEMYFTDTAGQVIRWPQMAVDGPWGAWESLGGSATDAPVVGHHDDGRLQVFIHQADGKVWSRSQLLGGGWGAWAAVSPVLFTDTLSPAIHSVELTPSLVAAGDQVHVLVSATDNVGVQTVTANGTALTGDGAGNWSGTVTADTALGQHFVVVTAQDAVGNSATNSTQDYTTARVYAMVNRSACDNIMADVQYECLFKTWGRVTFLTTDSFTLDDGSLKPITVIAPNHGLSTGQYAVVRGIINRLSTTEATLTTTADKITAYTP